MDKLLHIYSNFSGGLSEAANNNIEDNQLVEARNIMPGDGYGITRSCGTSIAFPQLIFAESEQNKIIFMYEAEMENYGRMLIIFLSIPDGLQQGFSYEYDTQSWNLFLPTANVYKDCFFHAGSLYWLTGSEYRRFNGSVVSYVKQEPLDTSITEAEKAIWEKVKTAIAVEQCGQRWFYATADNEIIFSEIGYPNKINPASIININDKNGDTITALHEFNEGLLIFKKHSVYYLAGCNSENISDIRLYNLNASSGTAFPRSVCTADNGVIYLGNNGVYRINLSSQGAVVFSGISQNISEGKISGRLFDVGQIVDAHATVWDNAYYLSVRKDVPQTTEEGVEYTTTVEYEYRYLFAEKAFFGEFTQASSSYAIGLNGENALFLGCGNGYILRYDKDSRNYVDIISGEQRTIDVAVKTKFVDVVDDNINKIFFSLKQYDKENSDITMLIREEYANNAMHEYPINLDEALLYAEGDFGVSQWDWLGAATKEIFVDRKCKQLQLVLNCELTEPFFIYGVGVVCNQNNINGNRGSIDNALNECDNLLIQEVS